MAGYNKWAARAELAGQTLRHTAGGLVRSTRSQAKPRPGQNFLNYGSGSAMSLAEMSGLLRSALATTDRPTSEQVVVLGAGAKSMMHDTVIYPTTLALVQSGHLPTAALQNPRLFAPRRFIASIVHYELTLVPRAQRVGIPLLDEVWTTSTFVQQAFSAYTSKPVRVVPVPIPEPPAERGRLRERLGLGEQFVISYQFDLASSGERKNPGGAVQAYLRAFPAQQEHVILLLKAAHAKQSPHIWAELNRVCAGRSDILLIDEYWPADVIDSYFCDIDAYLSLHRAEGFGMTIAKAMAAGKPVIATDYSGNIDLMDPSLSIPVPWRPQQVGANPIYPAAGTWADPDIDFAADALRELVGNPATGAALGQRAAEYIGRTRTPQICGEWLVAHLG